MRLKTGFAASHLQIAAQSARKAHEIEKANAAGCDEMMRLVPVSVVMAGAALEANANELIQDIIDGSVVSPPTEELLKDLKDDHSGNAWGRYRRSSAAYASVPKRVVRFRSSRFSAPLQCPSSWKVVA
jgi:hypothetical protein